MPVVLIPIVGGLAALAGANTVVDYLRLPRSEDEGEESETDSEEEEEEDFEAKDSEWERKPTPVFLDLGAAADRDPQEEGEADRECAVCMSAPVVTAFAPCRHSLLCEACAQKVRCCPVCRTRIEVVYRGDFKEDLAEIPEPPSAEEAREIQHWWSHLGTLSCAVIGEVRQLVTCSSQRPA